MSAATVQTIKQQLALLSPQEQEEIEQFLAAQKQRDALSNKQPQATPDKETKRQLRAAWLAKHRETYGGLYVALDGDRLLGTGRTYPEAFDAAKQAGVKDAYVGFIYPVNYEGSMGGWV